MTGPRALFLDVGGVLHLPDDALVSTALHRAGVDPHPDRFERAHYLGIAEVDRLPAAASSDEVWGAFVAAYAEARGVPEPRREAVWDLLGEAFRGPGMWSKVRPDSLRALQELAGAGLSLAIVSNSDGTLEERLRGEGICQVGEGPGTSVAAVVDSGAVDVEKPDPRIFEIALERTGVGAEHAVHVGDSVRADVHGAQGAGLGAVHFDPLGLCAVAEHDHVRRLDEVLEHLGP